MIIDTTYTVNAIFNSIKVDLQLNIIASTCTDADGVVYLKSLCIYSGSDPEENVLYDTDSEEKANVALMKSLGILCLNIDQAERVVIEKHAALAAQ